MNMQLAVPIVNIEPLHNLPSVEQDATDQALGDAARIELITVHNKIQMVSVAKS